MKFVLLLILLTTQSLAAVYEESIDEMLVECNSYQELARLKNRTVHDCEKEDPDEDYSYYITPMTTRYSKRSFLCVLFFKDEYTNLNFKLLLSHGNYKIDAYGINYNKPQGALFESFVSIPISILVILPDIDAPKLEILEWKINGEDQCPACGEKLEGKKALGLISGGTEADVANWPWHISLWKRSGTGTSYICGGAILNKKWTISAAHCMFSEGQLVSENALNIRIATGKLITTSYKSYNVRKLIVHEHYNSLTFENDIAMMKLKETLDLTNNFRSICFSQLVYLPKPSTGTAVGYGSTDRNSSHSDVLREVEIPIIDSEECRDSDFDFFDEHLFPGNFCAGQVNVNKGVCSGDSGGGFYVKINNNWYLQGLTSNTKKSDNPINPTCNFASHALFTNVSYYTDWINDKILFV